MRSKDATAAARVSAANALLDRGWGKAAQPLQNGDDGALQLIHRIERVIVYPENSRQQKSLSLCWNRRVTRAFSADAARENRISSASFWSKPARPNAARSRFASARRSAPWRNRASG
jgi:hypothetical protein